MNEALKQLDALLRNAAATPQFPPNSRYHGIAIATLMRPLGTVDLATGDSASAVAERSDVTAVPAMGVIAEGMVADLVLLDCPRLERARDLVRVHTVWRQGVKA